MTSIMTAVAAVMTVVTLLIGTQAPSQGLLQADEQGQDRAALQHPLCGDPNPPAQQL